MEKEKREDNKNNPKDTDCWGSQNNRAKSLIQFWISYSFVINWLKENYSRRAMSRSCTGNDHAGDRCICLWDFHPREAEFGSQITLMPLFPFVFQIHWRNNYSANLTLHRWCAFLLWRPACWSCTKIHKRFLQHFLCFAPKALLSCQCTDLFPLVCLGSSLWPATCSPLIHTVKRLEVSRRFPKHSAPSSLHALV